LCVANLFNSEKESWESLPNDPTVNITIFEQIESLVTNLNDDSFVSIFLKQALRKGVYKALH
jgi:hypothetical protein